ncbi:usherin [Patella vulgata]|uniref:usherin n=1 Tax=Patella vulgata TaxID=6465 RepID=UPI0024A924EA|nr:usherin [Patella vulgata]
MRQMVYQTAISFFINGPRVGLSDVQKATLGSVIQDSTGSYRLGQNSEGLSPFKGRLQDFHLYSELLTNREIAQLYTGVFPEVRIQSHCRCPPSHPRVKPGQTHYCIPNGVPDNAGDEILRVNQEAHPLEYTNDGDSNTIWISKFQSQVDLIVDLGDEFQVFYVVIQFYSPLPKAVTVERQRNNSDVWEVWQYYAENCTSYFNQDNNGLLPTSTSINCLQFGTNNLMIPYSRGNITFNILPQEPVPRPGYNDFYNTPELYDFVKAAKIRVRFQDHYFVTNLRHEYYGVYEYAVSARCNCHGHAETCDMSTLPYKCNCLQPSNTEGNQCETCQPLYNNKPFRLGDQTNDYNCQLCQCYNHASSCYYNVTLDQFPGQHDRGGGGVCVSCQDNTEGQMCDSCIDMYFRPVGKSLYDKDVCMSCNCNETGIAEVNSTCEKVGGQCPCKDLVSGRQCDICKDGYYNLQSVNPVGCETCDCSINGTVNFNVSCDINSGQCYCKRNVRNRQCDACEYGYYNLTTSNPDGCTPCDCDPQGSQSIYCDPDSGQCQCKENIVGLKCNECSPNFFNFSLGCVPCNCNAAGIEAGTICEPVSGQCVCKQQVGKRQCDTCKDGAYGFGSSPSTGCEVCTCNKAGVDANADSCDVDSGSCVCKERVFGRMCNRCKGNTWGLNITNPLGCDLCECDPTGTQQGDSLPPDSLACNNGNGQCSCLANRFGRQCEMCFAGSY